MERPLKPDQTNPTPLEPAIIPMVAADAMEHEHAIDVSFPQPGESLVRRDSDRSEHKSLRTRLAAGALAAISVVTFMGASSKENDNSSDKGKATTEAQAKPSSKSETKKKGILPVKNELMVPDSEDPTELATALYNNYAAYLNTGNEQFMQYQIVGMDSEIASKERAAYQEDQSYRSQAHKGFHRTFTINSAVAEAPFTADDSERIIKVRYTENEYLDNRAKTPIYKKYPGYYRLTLVPMTRTRQAANGSSVTDTVWLESYSEDLGAASAQSKSTD